jgi:hypothetical protein
VNRGRLLRTSEPLTLQLDEAECAHLHNLSGTANTTERAGTARPVRRPANRSGVRPGVQRILDSINSPAYVRNGRTDILATNRLGRALFADAWAVGAPFNITRYLFLDPRSQEFYRGWETVAADTATKTMHHPIAGDLELTGEALHLPGDPGLTIITYTCEPAGPTEQALAFLSNWSTREAATGQPTSPDLGRTAT